LIRGSAWLQHAYIGLLFVAGNLNFYMYPEFVGNIINSGQASAVEVGRIATAEFLPFGFAIVFANRILAQVPARWTGGLCLLLQLVMSYGSAHADGNWLVGVRAIYGLASGTLVWAAYKYVSDLLHAGRMVGFYNIALMTSCVILSWLVPEVVQPALGHRATIMFLSGIVALPAICLILATPARWSDQEESSGGDNEGRMATSSKFVLASVAAWGVFGTIFWVYAEPLSQNFANEPLARHWLTFAFAGQIVGAILSSLLADRLPYRAAIMVGLCAFVAQISSIMIGVGVVGFIFWTTVYSFFGIFLMPFFVNALGDADPSKKSVVYFPATQMLSSGLGPLLASLVISEDDLHAALWLQLAAASCAPIAFWIGMTLHRSRKSKAAHP
jgi:MFS family permease